MHRSVYTTCRPKSKGEAIFYFSRPSGTVYIDHRMLIWSSSIRMFPFSFWFWNHSVRIYTDITKFMNQNFFFFLSIKICIWALGNFGILAKKFSHNMYMYMYVYTHTLFYNKGLHTLLTCEWIFLMLYNPFIIL